MNALKQSVTMLPGVGVQTANRLDKLGIKTLQDLVFHLPHRYEDRTRIYPIGSLRAGMIVLVCGKIEIVEIVPGRKTLVCRISDNSGSISLRFFHFTAGQYHQFKENVWLSVFAEVRFGFAGLEMVHPDYCIVNHPDLVTLETRLTPVYPLTEGLSQKVLRKAVRQAINCCEQHPEWLTDWLPNDLLQQFGYPGLLESIQTLHAPDESISMDVLQQGAFPAMKRLAFEELLTHHLSLKVVKAQVQAYPAPVFAEVNQTQFNSLASHFLKALPFQLTHAQQRVIAEIENDCSQPHPMLRLVQGDVGSGKTIVAAYTALLALSAGYQVALMVPTELLAEQHFRNFTGWFAMFEINIVLLTGQLKGKARTEILQSIATGSAGIIIGTHALFQEQVKFYRLGLVIIDEQHRFGVNQRLALREKAQSLGIKPHQLVMTATPIPRTLAMLNYADLDLSIIDELPPGRKPVVTSVIPAERRLDVIARITDWVVNGRQVYWVCTLIEESEQLQCEAAEKTAETLKHALPAVRIGLLHGRMKAAEKEIIMQLFKDHQLDLLVATTVIEVGVDVPNAGLMIIENPERLGLSQLHQLRGRVGRGDYDSFCVLMYQSPLSEIARQRLGILRDSQDGFVIAEKDLQLRGPGEVMGIRQTGLMRFKIADLTRDAELLDEIQLISDFFMKTAIHAIQPLIARWLGESVNYSEV